MTRRLLSNAEIWGRWYQRVEAYENEMFISQLAHMNMDSSEDIEDYAFRSAVGPMRKWIGPKSARTVTVEKLSLRNEPYELSLDMPRRDFRDDKTDQLNSALDDMLARSDEHWFDLATELTQAAYSTTTYDLQTYFSKTHQYQKSGVHANRLTGAAANNTVNGEYTAFDIADPENPTALELANAIVVGTHHFRSFRDDVGQTLHRRPKAFTAVIPLNMGIAANHIMAHDYLVNAAGHRVENPLKGMSISINIEVDADLNDPADLSRFQLYRTDGQMKAFIMQEHREGQRRVQKAAGSDYEYDTGNWAFGLEVERAAGLWMWSSAISCEFN